jgi:hypothetical protein
MRSHGRDLPWTRSGTRVHEIGMLNRRDPQRQSNSKFAVELGRSSPALGKRSSSPRNSVAARCCQPDGNRPSGGRQKSIDVTSR